MNPQPADFNNRKLEDYITDQKFISWVLTPDDELMVYWNNILDTYPSQAVLIEKAKRLILGMNFKPELMDQQELNNLWMAVAEKTSAQQKIVRIIPLWFGRVAAACLAFVVLGSLFYYYTNRQVDFKTAYGEVRTIILPDSSVITLNANSELHYPKNWSKDKKREVWVSGEVFFTVNHLHRSGQVKENDRFIVHAGQLNIEVLGTTFNVHDRRGHVNVALVTGKISLERENKNNIIMKPGDVLEYIPVQDTIVRRKYKTMQKIAWKNGTLQFEQTPAKDVFIQLEDMYGYHTIIRNPAVSKIKLSGTFVTGSEEALLKGLSVAMGVTITKDKKSNQLIVE